MNLARLVDHQWRAVVVVVVLKSIGGLIAMTRVPMALFPDTNFPRIIIVIENGEVPAQQMLVTVTRPVEEAMSGMPGIARVKSITSRGAAEIDLFFDWRSDIQQTLQIVQSRVSGLATTLPPTARVARVERLTFAVFPIIAYSVTSPRRDPGTLRTLTELTIRPPLARVPGVGSVIIQGGEIREYHVNLDPARLESRGLTVSQVADALKNTNVIDSPGLIDENHHLELALVSGQAKSIEDITHIVIANVNNVPVMLSEVAAVGPGFQPRYTIVTADGQPAALVDVLRPPTANTAAVVDAVKQQLDLLKPQLPRDVEIKPFYDQSLLVRASVGSVRDAIVIGLVLSVLILYGFLRSWGTTLVAVAVIPLTILVTILAMWLIGLSFDLMTLGGVAAAIGLLIDDAIVVVEAIHTHVAAGASPSEAVHQAISEIATPIIGSTITPVVVFLPLSLLTGVTGVFFRSLALTMAVALLTSLVLALSFTPVLAERFIKPKRRSAGTEDSLSGAELEGDPAAQEREEAREQGRLLRAIVVRYEWLLGKALDNRAAVILVCVAVLAVSYLVYRNLGSEFLPEFDEGAFVLDYFTPPGTSLAETDRILKHVEQMLKEAPEVESYSRRTGLQLGLSITEPNTGDFLVKLRPDRKRST